MRAKHTSLTLSAIAAITLAGLAHADDKQAKPAPTPTPAPTPAPTPDPAAKRPPPPKPVMAPPTPSPALDAHLKNMKKAWRCKGTNYLPDGTSMPSDGTLTVKADLDKFWVRVSYVGKIKPAYKFEAFRTHDPVSGKWNLVLVDNLGGQEIGTSTGPDSGKVVWLTDARSARGTYKSRHTEQMLGKELKLWGEVSMDGKSWIKSYEVDCK